MGNFLRFTKTFFSGKWKLNIVSQTSTKQEYDSVISFMFVTQFQFKPVRLLLKSSMLLAEKNLLKTVVGLSLLTFWSIIVKTGKWSLTSLIITPEVPFTLILFVNIWSIKLEELDVALV